MIPELISKKNIEVALSNILRDGVPSRRRGRDYCVVAHGEHFPPKYTIALAHRFATSEFLSSDKFSGGMESNDFLRNRGFDVVECSCGGARHDQRSTPVTAPSERKRHASSSRRHSERCPECKIRLRELLKRLYGTCLINHRFRWGTSLTAYRGTQIEPTLRNVAAALTAHRGFGVGDFVKADLLAPCDFWVPDPGFIVEFDESQHFTAPRKLALSAYPAEHPLGFSTERWIALCEHHDARDLDPPFRDEQRAWYYTLRDLVPPLEGLQPTVRLYARDRAWCSMDQDSGDHRKAFSDLIRSGNHFSTRTKTSARSTAARTQSTLHVAMVFPEVEKGTSKGIPPSGPGAKQPVLPAAVQFAGELVDIVLFPEGYIRADDDERIATLIKLASKLNATLLVGAVDRTLASRGRTSQVLLRFDPGGSGSSRIYVKHSTAKAVAFESPDWDPNIMLPTLELGDARVGVTICHDHYLGLLPRHLAQCGAQLWVNPSFDNVVDVKWSSILRLRAVENRFFALCTLHRNVNGNRTHPFAFCPNGSELSARRAGSPDKRPLSQCVEAGNIYIVDLDMGDAGASLDWSKLPPATKPQQPRNGRPIKPVRVAFRGGHPSVRGRSRWKSVLASDRVETEFGPVFVGVVPGKRILDAAECFQVIYQAKQLGCAPIIWNHWERLPTDSSRLASLMMGRSIECCAPVVISDRDGICELVELANGYKIPARRTMEASGKWIADVGNVWGLNSAFNIVSRHLPRDMRAVALECYRSLM